MSLSGIGKIFYKYKEMDHKEASSEYYKLNRKIDYYRLGIQLIILITLGFGVYILVGVK